MAKNLLDRRFSNVKSSNYWRRNSRVFVDGLHLATLNPRGGVHLVVRVSPKPLPQAAQHALPLAGVC